MKKVAPIKNRNRFRLEPSFLAEFEGQQPAWDALGATVYKRTYARPLDGGGVEEFWQTLRRVTEDVYSRQCQQVRATGQHWCPERAQRHAQEFFTRMWQGKFLPSGRMLWFLGTRALEIKGGAALFNCAAVSTAGIGTDFADPFCWLMDFSMMGCGVGFDVLGAGRAAVRAPLGVAETFVVPDTREGWVDALRAVLRAFGEGSALPAFDYSAIRPEGTPLRTFGGTSSGHGPLKALIDGTIAHLRGRVGQVVTSTDIVDLMNRIGVCVVSGNVRRSSELALGSPDDADFIALKDPAGLTELSAQRSAARSDDEAAELDARIAAHPLRTHRWASNNSVVADGVRDFGALAARAATNGEPGFVWLDVIRSRGRMADAPDDADEAVVTPNPCGEIPLEHKELCNVPETFAGRHDSLEDWQRTLKYAYVLAKTVSLIPTHDAATNAVITRNRRLGISMAGVAEMYDRLGMRECTRWWDAGFKTLRALDADYSRWLGVNRSVRLTSVKPGGTVPLLFGVEGGMKFPSARHYFRTVRVDHLNPLVAALRAAGHRVEPDLYAPRTVVCYFPVANAGHRRTDAEVSLWEKAALLAALQRYWANNAVSNTLTFQPREAGDIARVLEAYAGQIKTVSFLPASDHGYAQAPYQPISAEEYAVAAAEIRPLDLSAAGHDEGSEEKFCSGDRCALPTQAVA